MNKITYYRCAFIPRGRGQQLLDQLLQAFALAVEACTPLPRKKFVKKITEKIHSIVPGGCDRKTAANYRTETIGKILGMYYFDENDNAIISERTRRFLNTHDQVQFFKEVCCKLQAPSGMSKKADVFIGAGVKIWPASFLLKVLSSAEKEHGLPFLTKKELNFFVLSNLDVLQSKSSPKDIADLIAYYRKKNKPPRIDGRSYSAQHSNEVINLLSFANLVTIFGRGYVKLNSFEKSDTKIINDYQVNLNWFSLKEYALNLPDEKQRLNKEWMEYNSKLVFPLDGAIFSSSGKRWVQAGVDESDLYTNGDGPVELAANEIGEAGEEYIYQKEKQRVKENLPTELSRVKRLGETKGLGYDIQSVFADASPKAENVFFIEVKSTFRSSRPGKETIVVALTSNEYKAAKQFKKVFYIFKVFLVGSPEDNKSVVYSLCNPLKLKRLKKIDIVKVDGKAMYTMTFPSELCKEVKYV